MERIPSFSKDHNILLPGLYECILNHGVTTWDLRFKKPNDGDYITPKALHTIEHVLATVLRNSPQKNDIIYFGPMGCRTGFYLLTVGLNYDDVKELLIESCRICLTFREVPGSKKAECGNYLEHDLPGALKEIAAYLTLLENL